MDLGEALSSAPREDVRCGPGFGAAVKPPFLQLLTWNNWQEGDAARTE